MQKDKVDEIVEKVLPYTRGHINYHSENENKVARKNLKKAITSGLLCDGKELEKAKKEIERLKQKEKDLYASQCNWIDQSVARAEEISSLKKQLNLYKANFLWPYKEGSIDEAGYEFANGKTKDYQEQWWKELKKRIFSLCEPVTVEALHNLIEEVVSEKELVIRKINDGEVSTGLVIAKAIHAEVLRVQFMTVERMAEIINENAMKVGSLETAKLIYAQMIKKKLTK